MDFFKPERRDFMNKIRNIHCKKSAEQKKSAVLQVTRVNSYSLQQNIFVDVGQDDIKLSLQFNLCNFPLLNANVLTLIDRDIFISVFDAPLIDVESFDFLRS